MIKRIKDFSGVEHQIDYESLSTLPDDEVFIATYGTTTYAEVKAAYEAGKACFCRHSMYALIPMNSYQDAAISFIKATSSNATTMFTVYAANDNWETLQKSFVCETNNVLDYSLVANSSAVANVTTKQVRNSILLDGVTYDAVTDWSTKISNGDIAWRYE